MRYAIPISITLHLLLLLLLSLGGAGSSREGDGKSTKPVVSIKVTIVDKPIDKPKPKIPVKDISKSKVHKKQPLLPPPELIVVDHKCEKFYYGIGYQNDGRGSCRIVRVPKGYPADRAGIRVDDLVMNPMGGDCPGQGELGTTITVEVMRGTQTLCFTMVREKICTSEEL